MRAEIPLLKVYPIEVTHAFPVIAISNRGIALALKMLALLALYLDLSNSKRALPGA